MNKDMKYEWMTIQWKKVLFGVCVSVVVTMVLTGVFAGLVSGQFMEEHLLSYVALGIIMLSSFLGAGIAGGRGQVINQLAIGVLYWVVLLGINAMMFDGNLSGMVPTLIAIFGGCAVALLVLQRGGGASKHKRRRYRRR